MVILHEIGKNGETEQYKKLEMNVTNLKEYLLNNSIKKPKL